MLDFFRNRRQKGSPNAVKAVGLGRLESAVMEILWARGEARVQEVVEALDRGLAYTTVMTTMDRLFKKGLLERTKQERAYVYRAALTRAEWERRRASDLVAGFLAGPRRSRELLLSCFLDAVSAQDAPLLDELEKQIRKRRRELSRRGAP
jgi:predicted transcriptional regulator